MPKTLHDILYNTENSRLAWWLALYFDVLILLSMATLFTQSVPALRDHITFWFILETIICAHFMIRFILKLISGDGCSSFFTWGSFSDLICVLPWPVEFYIFLVQRSSSGLRFMRILRFIRFTQSSCLKLPEMRLFTRALRRSKSAFLFLGGYAGVSLLCFAWAIYLAETASCSFIAGRLYLDYKQEVSCPMQSMFDSLWMCLCTIITVGYGDYYPKTITGKVLTGLMMIISYVMLPLPVAIFGANLTELYVEARLKRRLLKRAPEEETNDESDYPTVTSDKQHQYKTHY